jgi:hypothetical protein
MENIAIVLPDSNDPIQDTEIPVQAASIMKQDENICDQSLDRAISIRPSLARKATFNQASFVSERSVSILMTSLRITRRNNDAEDTVVPFHTKPEEIIKGSIYVGVV